VVCVFGEAKTSTRDVVLQVRVTCVIKVCYSVPLSSPPTHDILIMPRKLPGRTGMRSCAEQGIRSLGQTAGVLLRQILASSLAIDMGVSYYALSGPEWESALAAVRSPLWNNRSAMPCMR
jgi:hypothetical protein